MKHRNRVYLYRVSMPITRQRVYPSSQGGFDAYYVCPRCGCSLDREFCSFCGHCGQRLSWKYCGRASRFNCF